MTNDEPVRRDVLQTIAATSQGAPELIWYFSLFFISSAPLLSTKRSTKMKKHFATRLQLLVTIALAIGFRSRCACRCDHGLEC